MSRDLAFGVGCVSPEVVGAKTIEEWQKSVVETLNSIPSIREVELKGIASFILAREGVSPWGQSLEGAPAGGMLKFKVTIPTRVQADVARGRKVGEVEDFIVRTYFSRRHPVSFAVCEGSGTLPANPSASLMVVREFLNREIGKLNSPNVRLRKIGPSPFHANFFLKKGTKEGAQELSDRISVSVKKRQIGYDEFVFNYDANQCDHNEALREVFEWAIPELEIFYTTAVQKSAAIGRSISSMKLAEDLAKTYSTPGIISYLRRAIRNKRELLKLRLFLLQSRLQGVHELRRAEEGIQRVYSERQIQILKTYTEKVMNESYSEEIETAEKTLDVLDAQHTQEVQRLTTFCTSLLGVVVGALLTAWLRR
ncbi:hypothetical protein [Streptomyces sp. NPDC059142]|uniref:hypothetical protein n=1 Tax=Streptomyces sp. NPDC059142 TaxID=3346739 RepID=UPI0036947DDC